MAKRRAYTVVAGAVALLAAVLILWALVRRHRAGPPPIGLPDHDVASAKQAVVREENARVLFRWAQDAARRNNWRDAVAHIERLEEEWPDTAFREANRAAIAGLRARAHQWLRPREEGLAAAFYAGENFERFVTAKRVSGIEFGWRLESPLPNVPKDHFSTRIVGWLRIHRAGHYTFQFWRDDGARLYLDGKKLIDEWEGGCVMGEPQMVWLDEGWHRLWVDYMEMGSNAVLTLLWHQDGRQAAVPPGLLYCERELFERVRRDPAQDPLVGLRPDEPGLPPEGEPPSDFFRGALRRLPDGRVEFGYDWSDTAQLHDWPQVSGPRARVLEGELQLGGQHSGGLSHLARFDGDIELSGAWRQREAPSEDSSCDVTICRTGFFKFYRAKLRHGHQQIVKDYGATLIGSASAECPGGEPHAFRFVRSRGKLRLWIEGGLPAELTDPDHTRGTVDIGYCKGQVGYRDIRIVGRPDPGWLALHPGAAQQIADAPLADTQ